MKRIDSGSFDIWCWTPRDSIDWIDMLGDENKGVGHKGRWAG